jgi:hypothetical protein
MEKNKMFALGLTKDAPGAKWCKVWEIEKELYEYEKEIFPKYEDRFPFRLWICFRCLPREYARKSMRRYFKIDNALGIDISIDEEIMRPFADGRYHPLSKDEQRLIMGNDFYPFFAETFQRYKNKLPGIGEYGDDFVEDTRDWLCRNRWI